MLTQTQQVDLTLHHLKERTLSIYTPNSVQVSRHLKTGNSLTDDLRNASPN